VSQRTQRESVSMPGADGDRDARAFQEGTDFRLYRRLGAWPGDVDGRAGVLFSVWAPNAERVSVIGDFNDWSPGATVLARGDAGIWRGFAAGASHGAHYKYHIEAARDRAFDRPDPFARAGERPPANASQVWQTQYRWNDSAWIGMRGERMSTDAPWSIYELHLGSWRRDPARPTEYLGYRDLVATLPAYLVQLGFTHLALMPVTEHADYESWGYLCDGFFRPSARYGTPDDLRGLIDALHHHGIGVILDWTPATFDGDPQGLARFDGTRLYERDSEPQTAAGAGTSRLLDHTRGEVRSFVGSSALFWLDEFHVDALRLVGLGAMQGPAGGEAEAATAFLKTLNDAIAREYPATRIVADDASRWGDMMRPTREGGLGFDLAWDARSVRDALAYVEHDPLYRKHHHAKIAPELSPADAGERVLPLSHDEVAPDGRSLLGRIPGDDWRRFATLRLFYGYLWTLPGKPLLFMGGEFAQLRAWQPGISLDWHLLGDGRHAGVHRWVGDLNRMLREQPALQGPGRGPGDFQWLARNEAELSLLAFERRSLDHPPLVVICNFTPVVRDNFRLGVGAGGSWREIINSDAPLYGGSGVGNFGGVEAVPIAAHGCFQSIVVTAPPLGMVVLERSELADFPEEQA
jgi:1,4-alpha-glucan branching enzyme